MNHERTLWWWSWIRSAAPRVIAKLRRRRRNLASMLTRRTLEDPHLDDLAELSLALETQQGVVIVTGCSDTKVEEILRITKQFVGPDVDRWREGITCFLRPGMGVEPGADDERRTACSPRGAGPLYRPLNRRDSERATMNQGTISRRWHCHRCSWMGQFPSGLA